MANIITTYRDVSITYDEQEDQWKFTLRGNDRSVDSLVQAKAAIDKPASKKHKPFKRIEAWTDHRDGYKHKFVKVTVTSIVSRKLRWSDWPEVWIAFDNKQRTQIAQERVFLDTDENRKAIREIQAVRDKINMLTKVEEKLLRKLKHSKIRAEEESE